MKKNKKKMIRFGILVSLLVLLGGCASGMHGYTKARAQNKYMEVSEERQSFGFKRIGYIKGFRGDAIVDFIVEKGLPDYLYEYEKNGREGFIFYYIKLEKAFDFIEQNWRPTSVEIVEIRGFTDFERDRFGIKKK